MFDDVRKLVGRVSELFKKRLYGRTFRCPVCHLELAYADADGNGLLVCPVCGVVIGIEETYGHSVPVVHDVEIFRVQPKSRIHPMASHLPIGLFPFAVLGACFLFVVSMFHAMGSSLGERLFDSAPVVSQATLVLLVVSVAASTATFASGLWDWRHRYRGRPYRQIRLKIVFSIAYLVLGAIAILLHGSGLVFAEVNGLMDFASPVDIVTAVLYFGLLGVNTVVIATLGHVGGTLVFGK